MSHHPTHGSICFLVHVDDALLTLSALAGIQVVKAANFVAYTMRDVWEMGIFSVCASLETTPRAVSPSRARGTPAMFSWRTE